MLYSHSIIYVKNCMYKIKNKGGHHSDLIQKFLLKYLPKQKKIKMKIPPNTDLPVKGRFKSYVMASGHLHYKSKL